MAELKAKLKNAAGEQILPQTDASIVAYTTTATVQDAIKALMSCVASDATAEGIVSELAGFGSGYSTLAALAYTVKTFLESADTADETINRWKEIETFLAGITDQETLTGLLEALETKISDSLSQVKSTAEAAQSAAKTAQETADQAATDLKALQELQSSEVYFEIIE